MQFRFLSVSLVAVTGLAACSGGGGGGGGGGGPLGELVNTGDVVLSANGSSAQLTANGATTTLDLDSAFDRGTFDGASDLDGDGNGNILAYSVGDSTFATLLIDRDGGTTVSSNIGLTGDAVTLPSGQATLNGTYVGAFVDPENDPTQSYITGDATISVDLDASTISGSVVNLTSELLNSGAQEPLGADANIVLPETGISGNGAFSAAADRQLVDPEGEQNTTITTNWSGFVAGGALDTLEAAGQVTVDTTSGSNTQSQAGVFVAD